MVDKKAAIFNATLKLLVERGFYGTPMSEVAKHSGVSVGIIYHYFESKDDLIHQVYAEVKNNFSLAVIQGDPHLLPGTAMLKQVWLNVYHYCVEHPTETLFLEQYENSPHDSSWSEATTNIWAAVLARLEQDSQAGIYIDIPGLVFYDMTIKVAMSLAKRQIAGTVQLGTADLEKVAEAICRSVCP